VNDQQLREKIIRMVFVAEIKKSIYTHTSTRTLAGGIVLLFAQNPAELRFPLPSRKISSNEEKTKKNNHVGCEQ
jgi:hypothetical protein